MNVHSDYILTEFIKYIIKQKKQEKEDKIS